MLFFGVFFWWFLDGLGECFSFVWSEKWDIAEDGAKIDLPCENAANTNENEGRTAREKWKNCCKISIKWLAKTCGREGGILKWFWKVFGMILGRFRGNLGGQTAYKKRWNKWTVVGHRTRGAWVVRWRSGTAPSGLRGPPAPRQSEVTPRSWGGPF